MASKASEALRTSHVASDDEVSGAVVLSDDHVLDGLARTTTQTPDPACRGPPEKTQTDP